MKTSDVVITVLVIAFMVFVFYKVLTKDEIITPIPETPTAGEEVPFYPNNLGKD